MKKEDKHQYALLARLVNKVEKKAIDFVKKNLDYDSELRLKSAPVHRLSL